MKPIISLFFILFSFYFAQAQKTKVFGVVKDAKTLEVIPGVNVFENTSNGTVTNLKGEFELAITDTSQLINFSFIGYQNQAINSKTYLKSPLVVYLVPNTTELNTYVITASRKKQKMEEISVSMEILPATIIETKNTYNLETAMEQIPSVNIIDGQANIRGGSGFSYGAGSRVMVLLDGMPMIAGDANDVKWNYLPVENIDQVEVLKGASSVLFGSAALNGVINVRTEAPGENTGTKVGFFQGIYDNPVRPDSLGNIRDSAGNKLTPLKWWNGANPTFSGVSVSHSQRKNNFDYAFQVNGFNDQGYRQGETEQRLRGNFQTRYRVNNNLQFGLNGGAMASQGGLFLLWDTDSTALIPSGGIDTATTTISFYHSKRFHLDPYLKYFAQNGDEHLLRGRYFLTDNQNITQPSALAHSYFMEYQYTHLFSEKLKLVSGVAAQKAKVLSVLYGNHNSLNVAGYGQLEYKWKRLSTNFGARLEHYKIDNQTNFEDWVFPRGIAFSDSNTVWNDTGIIAKRVPLIPVLNLGINYQVFKATFIRASFGQGYRFPSIAERFVNTSISVLNIFPNPNLIPEKGWNAEIGLKQGFAFLGFKGFADVAAFYTEYRDMMEFAFNYYPPDTAPEFPNLGQFVSYLGFKSLNVGKARISGIDFSVAGNGKIGSIETNILAGYTFMNPINLGADSAYKATFSDSSDNPILKYRMRHLAKGDLMLTYKKFTLGGAIRYQSFMENIDRTFEDPLIGNSDQFRILKGLKPYRQANNKGNTVVDLRLVFKVKQNTSFSIICNNVFNKEYMLRPGDIQPQRTFAVRFDTRF